MAMNKRGVIEDLMAFLVVFVIMSIIFLIVVTLSGGSLVKVDLVIDENTGSNVCDQDLLGYLRAATSTNLKFSQLATITAYNPDAKENFELETNASFEKFKRGDETRQKWYIHLLEDNQIILKVGTLQQASLQDICRQQIPSISNTDLVVEMGVEY